MQYGLVNPQKVFKRYDIEARQPDSGLVKQVFTLTDMGQWLTKIQPGGAVYVKLQKQLLTMHPDTADTVLMKKITTLKLNMERLRWQITPKDSRYIMVNIPAFKFQWIDSGKVIFDMKVCVGEPKPKDYDDQLKKYLLSKNIDDRPFNHETTILSSRITTIQLNPTWNIPKSIAQNEIYKAILKSPTYLADNNIKVYLNRKKIPNPEAIKWAKIPRDKIPFTFVQDASDLNALGKFKFIFDNESSIYLHDTPNKLAFNRAYRAVSHGCVRVDDPLKLCNFLIADTNRVDDIRMEVGLQPLNKNNLDKYKKLQLKRAAKGFELQSKYITLKHDIQLFIDYYTCWPDARGNIVFYNDVYRKDDDLQKAIGKYLSK